MTDNPQVHPEYGELSSPDDVAEAHDALVALIEQHRYTLYDEDGFECECRNLPKDESYAEHLAKLIENLGAAGGIS